MTTLWAIRRKQDSKLLGITVIGTDNVDFCGSYETTFNDYSNIPHFFETRKMLLFS